MYKNKISVIAETAWHHEGDFSFMVKLVHTLIETSNVDIIKLHLTLDIDEYMAEDHEAYDMLNNWLLSEAQWHEIITLIKASDKQLMLLFNDRKSIAFGMQYQPDFVEIHSVSLNDIKLLHCLRESINTEVKVFIGIGGCTLYEVEKAIQLLGSGNIVLMFGFQNYPTNYHDINFEKMRRIMSLFPQFEFGYADHCAWDEPYNELITVMGASLGCNYIEKHVTISYGIKRCDWNSAVSIDMINNTIKQIRVLESCNGDGQLKLNQAEKKYAQPGLLKKSVLLNRDVKKSEIFTLDQIDFKRTSQPIDHSQQDVLLFEGKQFKHDKLKNDPVYNTDFNQE